MPESPTPESIAKELFYRAATAETVAGFLSRALPAIREALRASAVTLARADKGRWRVVATTDPQVPLPTELLGEVLDREMPLEDGGWLAAPIDPRVSPVEVCALHNSQLTASTAGSLVDPFRTALSAARHTERSARRIERLEAILEIASEWRQTSEMDVLLTQMAEASTRLLEAERASIFLWDKPNKTLVGRPALGVEGGELRIPDNTGIVGQVVHSGESRRVDADEDQREINRQVDRQLNFQTRSLLCVPLRGRDGELFGGFEMVNKIGGNFDDDDLEALAELAAHAAVALENTQQYEQLLKTRNRMADQAAEGVKLIGQCPAIESLQNTVRRVAKTELAILILGENGTGKEVVSQQVHYLSRRRNEPFVAINCAALTETLLESELFGHEKGAFTDARDTRIGKFELASGGTLFLDEIGDMSLSGQAKLLRVLEEKIVVRVGGSLPIHTDARVIAATNQNLADMVRAKRFREDLYFRLNVVTLELPPLRDRGDDVLLLAEHFLRDFCIRARRKPAVFTAAARKRLLGHSWPGNVRELRNLMERLAYLSNSDKIDVDELSFTLAPGAEKHAAVSLDLPLTEATHQFQIEYIQRHIERARGNMTDAAERLGLHRSNLYRKMRQLDMPTEKED